MLEPSFARERLAIYHRAMEAKNQGRDRQACLLLRESVSYGLICLPEVPHGCEEEWWETHMPFADSEYKAFVQAVNASSETVKAPDFVVGWTATEFVDACEQFLGGRRND